MVLQAYSAFVIRAETRPLFKLCARYQFLPVVISNLSGHQVLAVEIEIELIVQALYLDLVPFTDGLHCLLAAGDQVIEISGLMLYYFSIGMTLVIYDLHFRARFERVIELTRVLMHAEHDPAISGWRDLPFRFEVEVLELIVGHDVAAVRS